MHQLPETTETTVYKTRSGSFEVDFVSKDIKKQRALWERLFTQQLQEKFEEWGAPEWGQSRLGVLVNQLEYLKMVNRVANRLKREALDDVVAEAAIEDMVLE